ncbi:hypothetical protein [Streptosporangium sp. NPDC020145]|uniref:hypothetical protein n=1 Tax=Streptosporangium sp. NPDC020145 TaxID=3154694 RepID=UPI00343530F7
MVSSGAGYYIPIGSASRRTGVLVMSATGIAGQTDAATGPASDDGTHARAPHAASDP